MRSTKNTAAACARVEAHISRIKHWHYSPGAEDRVAGNIILCVRWYLRYKLSLRDLVEMMAERGL
jgi:hypothetical protein